MPTKKPKKSKKTGEKVIDILGNALLVLAIVAIILSLFSLAGPRFFGAGIFWIKTGSMLPKIKPGSIVIYKKQAEYKEKDVIIFKRGSSVITHRITGTTERDGEANYKTKGDNNKDEDLFLAKKSDVFGKVFGSVPFLGYLIIFAKTKWGIMILILIPAIWIISGEGMKIKRALDERKKGKKEEKVDKKEEEVEEEEKEEDEE